MANLTETSQWDAAIYQLDVNDPVLGGVVEPAPSMNGMSNRQAQALANRTLWLKNAIDNLATATDDEIDNLNTVIQQQLISLGNAKQNINANLTALSQVTAAVIAKMVEFGGVSTVGAAELAYLAGVTSGVQTQLNSRVRTVTLATLPTSDVGPVWVADAQDIWVWVPANSYWSGGYRSPHVGEILYGVTATPRPFERASIGGTLSKTDPSTRGLWAYAQEENRVTDQATFDANLGAIWFVSVDANTFRVPNMLGPMNNGNPGYGMFLRLAAGGTDADTANARAFGSAKRDTFQGFSLGDGSVSGKIKNQLGGAAGTAINVLKPAEATAGADALFVSDGTHGAPRIGMETVPPHVAFHPRIHV
jgi:hypothetical protein